MKKTFVKVLAVSVMVAGLIPQAAMAETTPAVNTASNGYKTYKTVQAAIDSVSQYNIVRIKF